MSLRPLRAALSGWRPSATQPGDPLLAIAAAWARIVGPAIARQTRPVQVVRDTLVVVTRSSAWSQQLSLLADDVLRGLHAIAEASGIERLRFRVGRISAPARTRNATPRTGSRAALPESAPLPPDAPLSDVVAHLHLRMAQRQSVHGACPICSATRDEPGPCAQCVGGVRAKRRLAAERLMYDAPWLGYAGIAALVGGLGREEYERWRRALLNRWWMVLERSRFTKRVGAVERRVASSYALLQSGLQPDQVTPAVVRNLLGDELAALLDGGRLESAQQSLTPRASKYKNR